MGTPITDYLDLTYLGDEESRVLELITLSNIVKPQVLCLSPCFIHLAKSNTKRPIATVINFPQGTDTLTMIQGDIKQAIIDGVNEIDFVFPYRAYLDGEKQQAFEQTKNILKVIPNHITTKAIIETSVYDVDNDIVDICKKLIELKVDFIKTSTGLKGGADRHSASIILKTIKNFDHTRQIGFKASGGIRTKVDATSYLALSEAILDRQLTPKQFRIGSSSLK